MSTSSRRLVSGIILSIIAVTPFTTFAQEASLGGIQVGPGSLIPRVETQIFHDDNLFNSVSGTELETWGTKVSPDVTYEIDGNISRFAANWDVDAGFYDESSDDDYVDQALSALYEYEPTDRFRGAIRAGYLDTHDPRGTGRAEGVLTGITADPDEWHSYSVNTNLGFGALSARAQVEADLALVTKVYDNNLESTAFRDRDDVLSAARFFYRIAPKTSLVMEGRYATAKYNLDAPFGGSLNSDTYRALGGVTWVATARTIGSVKVGYIEKDFKTAIREDGDAINWEANIQWSPRTYSVFNLTTSRDFNETNGAGNFIESDTYSVDWTHFWAERISTTADLGFIQDSFDPTTRRDDRIVSGLRLNYIVQRWLTLSGGYRFEDRDSNRDDFDYKKNQILISATLNL